jgi:CarD family transcriptional regulator
METGKTMTFQVGDKVVHWSYGLGEIIKLDQKRVSGKDDQYFVVQVKDMTLWVPVLEAEKRSLRLPASRDEFQSLFYVLSGPGDPLSEDRMERKTQLTERMRDGKLESICRVIRDLNAYSRKKKLSENDTMILERARKFLLEEWIYSLEVPMSEAQRELEHLLNSNEKSANVSV